MIVRCHGLVVSGYEQRGRQCGGAGSMIPLLAGDAEKRPEELALFSPINSMPETSSACAILVSEPTTPRTSPLLASMRWMVGPDTPARAASVFWSMPRRALWLLVGVIAASRALAWRHIV